MSLDTLKALPVPSLFAQDCAVFLWATFPTLPEAIELGSAWGLIYKTCAFLWSKTTKRSAGRFVVLNDPANWHMGMGFWSRANTEPCLLFTKGSPRRKSKAVRQLIIAPVRRHSQKPDEQYSRIEALVDGPYCELFARQRHENWDCWGNEVENSFEIPTARRMGQTS
jgi:N6-adenosine-specific RNA methylase IME4